MTAQIRKYTDIRAWLRHLVKGSIHAGTGALLAGGGTNTAEAIAPELLKNVGMDLRQMLVVFATAAFFEALRRINAATADTTAPFTPPAP